MPVPQRVPQLRRLKMHWFRGTLEVKAFIASAAIIMYKISFVLLTKYNSRQTINLTTQGVDGHPSPSLPSETTREVHIFSMVKDDGLLLLDWALYYSALVGISNIHIVDNGSKDPLTYRILSELQVAGMDIISYFGGFQDQKFVHTRMMHRFAEKNGTFLVALDTDEFIVAAPSNCCAEKTFCVQPECIVQAFQDLPMDGKKYKFWGMSAYNCNELGSQESKGLNMWSSNKNKNSYRSEGNGLKSLETAKYDLDNRVLANKFFTKAEQPICTFSKTFYNSQGFMWTEKGNHVGRVRRDSFPSDYLLPTDVCMSRYHISNLILVHYSASSYDEYKKKIVRGVLAYGYDKTVKAGVRCKVAPGQHYCEAWWKWQKEGESNFRLAYETDVSEKCAIADHSDALSRRLGQLRFENTLRLAILKT